ncbi:uncharacterized protein LTR77_007757 [Saxophila tyrrhenica]|uniref:FAD-dependent oxidoreductase domain-containing protein 1 n=1 Tax=Saxophila tyrrhenica TaxID=1690608 RepID=A0AAV9P3M6_9PEZI|nr:hypothetical protein LTR77_007757 [Saxophila tyrrhenica]
MSTGPPDQGGPPKKPREGTAKQESQQVLTNDDGTQLNVVDGWEQMKIKTQKCKLCEERIRKWSWRCKKCLRHICSECLDSNSTRSDYQKAASRDHVEVLCWCDPRFGLSQTNPAFSNMQASQPPPPKRFEEEARAREAQKLAAATREARTKGITKPKPKKKAAKELPESAAVPSPSETAGKPEDDFVPSTKAENDGPGQRAPRKRKLATRQPVRGGTDETPGEEATPRKKPKVDHQQQDTTSAISTVSHAAPGYDITTVNGTHPTADDFHITILGAGFVGLFVARQLALEAKKAGAAYNITVVDVQSAVCQAASAHCDGILSTEDVPEAWHSLAQKAKEAWLGILALPNAHQKLDFSAKTSFIVYEDGLYDREDLPSWFTGGEDVYLQASQGSLGRLDSTKLASWLLAECQNLDVSFRFNHTIANTSFDDYSKLTGIHLQDYSKEGSFEALSCSNLILAAGPFTTYIFDQLFANQVVSIDNNIRAAHWFTISATIESAIDDVALRLPKAAATERKLQDQITMVARPTANTVKVTGFGAAVSKVRLPPEQALQARAAKTNELRALTAPYLNREGLNLKDKKQVQAAGRSELSTADGDAPIIDRVPASALGISTSNGADGYSNGVWLCYGFGRHGTLLAPGAARVLASKMFGGGEEMDGFGLPAYEVPEAQVHSKGKGKAKAV